MFFWTLLFAALLGWGSWGVVLGKISPFTSPEWGLPLFFLSFFVALAATFSLIFYFLRQKSEHQMQARQVMGACLRQGALVALMICIATLMQLLRVLTWWNVSLLFLVVLLLEFYWAGRK